MGPVYVTSRLGTWTGKTVRSAGESYKTFHSSSLLEWGNNLRKKTFWLSVFIANRALAVYFLPDGSCSLFDPFLYTLVYSYDVLTEILS